MVFPAYVRISLQRGEKWLSSDRSWYNRAGVERVMDSASEEGRVTVS